MHFFFLLFNLLFVGKKYYYTTKILINVLRGSEEINTIRTAKPWGRGQEWARMRPNMRVGISVQITCDQWASRF